MRTDATSAGECREDRRGSSAADTVLRWPIIVAVALPVIPFILLETPAAEFISYGYGAYLLLALLLAWVAAAIAGALIALAAARRGAWRRAASAGIAPLLVLPTVLYHDSAWSHAEEAADIAHFYVMRSSYLARPAVLPGERGTRVALFYWRGMAFNAYGVLYDESDEVMRPPEQRSAAWQARLEDGSAAPSAASRPLSTTSTSRGRSASTSILPESGGARASDEPVSGASGDGEMGRPAGRSQAGTSPLSMRRQR